MLLEVASSIDVEGDGNLQTMGNKMYKLHNLKISNKLAIWSGVKKK